MLTRDLLHTYQTAGVDFIKDNKRCALFMEMGLGKTITTLTALVDLFATLEIKNVLIIAPLRVAHTTWPNEIEAWVHTKDLPYTVIKGGPKARERLLNNPGIHIINRENVRWLVDHYKKKWPYDTVIVDELSSFKSLKAKRFKKLRSVCRKTHRFVGLTGTPAPNGLLDLWPQIYLLDQGQRLMRTMGAYKNEWFIEGYMGYTYTPRKGASDEIHSRLTDICMTVKAKDYLKMPSRIDNKIRVSMPPKALKVYAELENDFITLMDGEEPVTAANAAVLVGKLLQVTSGALYTDDEGNYTNLHDEKLDALAGIIEEAAGEPVLIAYNFKHEKERILKRFKQAVELDKNPKTIDKWNRGEIPVLLVHPASAGHGLNLQKGGHIAVWFGLNWSLELYQQFNARLHRQGQEKPVFIHHIVCDGTVDSTVMEALSGKELTQNALLDALKRDIRR